MFGLLVVAEVGAHEGFLKLAMVGDGEVEELVDDDVVGDGFSLARTSSLKLRLLSVEHEAHLVVMGRMVTERMDMEFGCPGLDAGFELGARRRGDWKGGMVHHMPEP